MGSSTVPRWGWHRRKSNGGSHHIPYPFVDFNVGSLFMPGSSEKLYNGWWIDGNMQQPNNTLIDFIYLFCVLPANVLLLFATSVILFASTSYVAEHIILATPYFTKYTLWYIDKYAIWATCLYNTNTITGLKNLLLAMMMKLLEPPEPGFMQKKYLSPLHKMVSIAWYSQFMWLGPSAKVTQDEEMDLETDAVMKQRVADSTRGGYNGRNVSFMIWLFDNDDKYHHLLEPAIVPRLEEGHAKDKARRTKRGKPSVKRDYLREACLEALVNNDPTDPKSMPIKLESLEFRVFTRFLSTFKKQVKKRKTNETNFVVDAGGKVETIRLSQMSFRRTRPRSLPNGILISVVRGLPYLSSIIAL